MKKRASSSSVATLRGDSVCGAVQLSMWHERLLLFASDHSHPQLSTAHSARHPISYHTLYHNTMVSISLLDGRFTKLGNISHILSPQYEDSPSVPRLHTVRSPVPLPRDQDLSLFADLLCSSLLHVALGNAELESERLLCSDSGAQWYRVSTDDLEALMTIGEFGSGFDISDESELAQLSLADLSVRLDAQILVLPETPCTSFVVRPVLSPVLCGLLIFP